MPDQIKRSHDNLYRALVLLCVAVLGASLPQGCDNSFSPKGDFSPRLIVYCVLLNDVPYQIVRVEQTYDSDNLHPDQAHPEPLIPDATVLITTGSQYFRFTDTLLTMPDGKARKVWISRSLIPMDGREYTIRVSAPGFEEAFATIVYPSRTYVQVTPLGGYSGSRDTMLVKPSYDVLRSPPAAYYYRLHVAASAWVQGQPVEHRREVPLARTAGDSSWIYSVPSEQSRFNYATAHIKMTRELLRNVDSADALLGIIAVSHAMDIGLYQYYKVNRGFQDPLTIRADIPDISNISRGLGVFGAMATDSIRYIYKDLIR